MDQEEAVLQGEAKIAARIPSFDSVAQGIEDMSKALVAVFEKVAPDKICVEFNVGISMDAGKLVALFFDTTATGSMKVSLQWGKGGQDSSSDE
jgi:NTP-dependent ternary system trypsin peptidase co-occuring protein